LGESSLEKSMAVDYFHRLCPTVTVIGGWHENRFRDFHWGGMRRRSLISVSLEWILLMDPTLLFSTSFPSGNYRGIGPLREEREEIDKWNKVPGGYPWTLLDVGPYLLNDGELQVGFFAFLLLDRISDLAYRA
jgi:hypothetical protein